jgi:hypothetical protein
MWAVVMLTQYGMRNVAVRDELYWAVIVAQLLLGNYVGVVAVDMTIDAHNASHNARYCADVVRDDHNSHLVS